MANAKTCQTCPSYLEGEDQLRARFGKSPGVPMCGRFGHVLGRPGDDANEEILIHFGSNCSEHGRALTSEPVSINPRVAEPDADIIAKGATGETLGTCNACGNCINQGAVAAEVGYPLGICKAKGTLIFKPMSEVKDCQWATAGSAQMTTAGITLQPYLQVGFKVEDEVKLTAIMGSMGMEIMEPTTYESDLPVKQDDAAMGIRAWRKYVDDDTGNDYYLPIFDRDFFTEEEQDRIPVTGQDFGPTGRPEAYVDHAGVLLSFLKDAYSLSEYLCLIGRPGDGKSQFGIHLAWLMQVPFERFAIRPDMNVEDFIGHPDIEDGRTFFVEGRFPRRMERPGVLMHDEINAGPDDVRFAYRALLDTGRVQIDYKGGYSKAVHDYCFNLFSMNPAWDARNIGALEMADADSQRLSWKWVPTPPDAVIKHILTERCTVDGYDIPTKVLDAIVKIHHDIVNLEGEGYPGTWSLRQDIKVARKTAHYSLVDAYKRAALDAIEPDAAELVLAAVNSYGVK